MIPALDLLVGAAMGLNLVALGSGRLPSIIRAMSLQGVLLGVMPLLLEHEVDGRVVVVAAATVVGKGVLIPYLLRRATRAAHVDRELRPYLGFVPSLLVGAACAVSAVVAAHALPLLPEHAGSLLVPGSIATVLTGFVLLVGRTKAISQVCGFLILENGIYLFGLLLIEGMPVLVEAGVLLDLTVGVFVLGIIVDRIQRAFDSLDTRRLTTVRE
jgi:hydrogenase-4 component E